MPRGSYGVELQPSAGTGTDPGVSPQEKSRDHTDQDQEREGDDPGHGDLPEKDLEGNHLHVLQKDHSAKEKDDKNCPRFCFHD